jgi:Gig2-like
MPAHLHRILARLREEWRLSSKQREAFLQGRSAPDFAAMNFEVDFNGRATVQDLTNLGRAQMGF